ncbi:MAG: DUF1700 domain-containing protein [Coriobacteriia bacterium]|nr:DUF1700 domain-containing protein [Coriobacteriia bacterium]
MTKIAFLSELQHKLKGMPESEVTAAMAYYEEYLAEAGSENEQAAIVGLGSPAEVAAGIIGDYVYADTTGQEKTTRKGLNAIWMVVIGVFAAPIALPLALLLIGIIFSLLVTVLTIIFWSFLTAAIALFGGIAYVGVGFHTLFFGVPTGLITIGMGLATTAFGGALAIILIWLTKHAINGIARGGAVWLRRWDNRKEVAS